MSKNYMPEVARMLGVEIGEEFDIFDNDGEKIVYSPYKITDNAIVDCEGDPIPGLFYDLLTSKYTLQKCPWRPKDGEKYWLITNEEELTWRYFYESCIVELALLNMGNCFPAKKAAKAAVPEMLAKFEEIKKGVRE